MADSPGIEIAVATPHGNVMATAFGTDGAETTVILAHGAGAGQSHPWMRAMALRLAGRGLAVVTFDYAYTQAGRKSPDRIAKLLDVHEAVWLEMHHRSDRLILAGKSMGGRVGGHLVAEGRARPDGLVYYGYPLVAMGSTEPRPTDHVEAIDVPQLFVSGDRDRLGPIDLIAAVAERSQCAEVVVIADGDHSFVPRKATGRTLDDSLDTAADATIAWIERLSRTPCEEAGSDRRRRDR